MRYTVKQTPRSRTWGVYDANGTLVEGGFFARKAAVESAKAWSNRDNPGFAEYESEDREDRGRYQSGYRVYRDGSYREDFGSDM